MNILLTKDPNQNRKDIHPNKFLQFVLEVYQISDKRQKTLEMRVV
jgi:hypothetical protein